MADVNELLPVTDEDRAVAEAIVSGARGYAVKLPNDGHSAIQLVAQHRLATRAAPPAMDREALQKGLEFAVLTLAFHGRDRGTDREAKTLDDLEQLARELDPLMRRALVAIDSRSGHPDDEAVDRFAALMKAKLAASRAKGRDGWDDPAKCSTDYLRTLLHEHVAKGDPVDVANFCMMLAHYGASTTLSADAIRQGEGLRALSDRATPGPWSWEQCGEMEDVPVVGIAFPGDDPDCKAPYEGEFRDSDANRMTIAFDWQSCDGHSPSANAAFAVAAVNFVRKLLATPASHASDGGK